MPIDAIGLNLSVNAEIDPEHIYEVAVGSTTDGTLVLTLCKHSEDSSTGIDVLYRLRTKFDIGSVKAVGNTLRQEYVLPVLHEQVKMVVDLHLQPYYVHKDKTDGLYYCQAKRSPLPLLSHTVRQRAATNGTRWRYAAQPTATPPAASSQSFLPP